MCVAFLALEFPAAFFLFRLLLDGVMVKQEDKKQFWEVVRGVGLLIPRHDVEENCEAIPQESQWHN